MEELKTFADISADEIEKVTADGVDFRHLTLQQYLKVYTASSKDGYRKDVRNKKDTEKIALIMEYMKKETSSNVSAQNNVIVKMEATTTEMEKMYEYDDDNKQIN